MISKSKKKDGTYSLLCSKLDLTKENGLVEIDSDAKDEFQRYIFRQAKEKLGIDSIFFFKQEGAPSVPLIYFSKMEYRDRDKIAQLHKLVWNIAQAPLLFVILPDVVLIYNAYKPPKMTTNRILDDLAGFMEELNLFINTEYEIQKIMKYHRSELVTGSYWQKHIDKFKKEERVYQTLLDNLDVIKKRLIDKGLSLDIIHSLLIRSIFLKYLEDRKDNNGHNVFPDGYFKNFLPEATNFIDLLSDPKVTYNFFQQLNIKFNGDLFLLDKEEEKFVTKEHLELLQRLFKGEEYLDSGQTMLWPLYAFDVIPIELISNIYQRFLNYETGGGNREIRGIYYTPYHLVTFLMDQVLPWDGKKIDFKILDPSCGSGIFLVEAYRRLISRWMQKNPGKHPSITDLTSLLTKNIFGVDIDSNAIKIAALSIYLTICDYLEPREIWNKVKFEPIINSNLFVSDFFDKNKLFSNEKYDIIIGNPPWKSELSDNARNYLKENRKPVGDYQISQAFLWRVGELCKENGTVCMIVSSKGLLFNISKPNKDFRNNFFSSFNIKSIINFSAMRRILFSEAVAPGAAVIFSHKGKEDDQPIFYCSPKPKYSPQDDWSLVIEPQDIAYIPKDEVLDNDIIWKVSMWGSPRDYELIKKMDNLPRLRDICGKKGWVHGEGYIIGNGQFDVPEFYGKKVVDSDTIQRFTMDESPLPINQVTNFYRYAKDKPEIFQGPHLLIRQSYKADVGIIACILENDTIFSQSIIGIHSKKEELNELAAICLAINTNIPLYYGMLTSSRWLVERDEFAKEEIMDIPIPRNIFEIKKAYTILLDISKNIKSKKIIDEIVKKFYNLDDNDLILINDAITYTLDYFRKKSNSIAVEPADEQILNDYTKVFCNVMNNSFSNEKKIFVGHIYPGDGPLRVASVSLENLSEKLSKKSYIQNIGLKEILNSLEKTLNEEGSQSIYVKRNLRRYSGHTIFIIKQNQKRFWTKSNALRDADETYEDIMSLWTDSLGENFEYTKSTI